jgi:uncharacterized protein (TIGR02145 family)
MKKIARLILISSFLILSVSCFSQDLLYTVSGEINDGKTALDSILFENLTNGTRLLFKNLPDQPDYIINLTNQEQQGTTGIVDLQFENSFKIIKNIPGSLSIACMTTQVGKVNLSIYNIQGQQLYSAPSMMLKSGSSINVDLGIGGVYFVKLVSALGSKTFKAIGALNSGILGTSIQDNNSNISGSFKSSFHLSESDFSFNEGDSLRVSIYKNEYYSRPKVFEIVESDLIAFVFDVSDVETFGTSDGYVSLDEETQDVLVYEPTSGEVQITSANQELEINPGDIITVDVDTTGFLRKVVKVEDENGVITLETEQAYLNDIFVNTNLKLNTEFREPQVSLKSASALQIINALTDDNGYIHPVEVIYYDKLGKITKKSATGNTEASEASINIIDFYNDFAGTDLYGKAGDDVHFYIEEGHASVVSNAVFELDFGFDGGITEDTKVKKGDLKSFDFYLDTEADFQTKLALDMSKSYEKKDTKTIFDFKKVTAKFIVPPGIPVWITFDCDIFGNYHLTADAMLHADWGFESNHILKVGAHYDRATDSFTPIKEYDPTNTIYPLNIQGEINAMARLELYPRIDIKFYSFFGPYAEIVPYVEGNYNAALQSQITPSGSESFLAWNSGIDLGLDFRVGAELSFLGVFEKEFGPTVVNCFDYPLWKSPENLELQTNIPEKVDPGSKLTLNFKVTDLLNLPVTLCPVYISGDGDFNKNIGFTDVNGELNIDWTVENLSGNNSFSATIYNADKTIIKTIEKTISVAVIAPVADFSASATEIVEGETIQFTDLSTNEPTEWSWNFGDGGTGHEQNPSHTYTTAGTYHITLTVTNEADSDTEIKSGYITVTAAVVAPVADFSASATEIVEGETIQFTDLSTNEPTEWSWNFGDGGTGHEQNPSHTYTTAGTYHITLTVTNEADSDTEIKSNYITVTIGGGGEFGTVTNPITGKIWMDRNLGASQVATSSTDADAYGDLYQWGRGTDGHEKRTSGTTSTLATNDTPGHGDFIVATNSPYDWRSPQNDNLWQGVSGTNNPCPSGYRLPTEAEWEAERTSWSSNNSAGAYASPLKLPVAGYRKGSGGSLYGVGSLGGYWSSTVDGPGSHYLVFGSSAASIYNIFRAYGISVRCLKD